MVKNTAVQTLLSMLKELEKYIFGTLQPEINASVITRLWPYCWTAIEICYLLTKS
jgi:hypothetical protein